MTMSKKIKTKFDDWDFKVNLENRVDNLKKLEDSYKRNTILKMKILNQLNEIDYQLGLTYEQFKPTKPDFEFEKSESWFELLRNRLKHQQEEAKFNLERVNEVLEREANGIDEERLRVLFISEKVPAWMDAVFADEKRKRNLN
jgi:hypothetical protein